MRDLRHFVSVGAIAAGAVCAAAIAAAAQTRPPARLELHPGDRVVILGNTTAERMREFNHFETRLMMRFPELDLVVRNLGWSGDTITLQPRPLNFGDAAKNLTEQRADVIIAFFGYNESFAGEAGLAPFEHDLDAYLAEHLQRQYNGHSVPRMALVSPMAQERVARLEGYVDVEARNRDLARYTEAMRRVAAARGVAFVDLFTPSKAAMAAKHEPFTINGVHVTDAGDAAMADWLMSGLGFGPPESRTVSPARQEQIDYLRETIRDKNQQFFYRWRPVNSEYVIGRRVEPFGSVNFPGEMKQLDQIVADRDRKIWDQAKKLKGAGR